MSKLSIREWAISDRPREKLLEHGRRTLTDAELLAILIGSGSNNESAVVLCQRILKDSNNNLNTLARKEVQDLSTYKGIGEAKAISIIAALELGRRRKDEDIIVAPILNSSKKVFEYFRHNYQDLPHEEFWVIYLTTACKVITTQLIGRGGNDFTPVDVRIILRYALEYKAHSIILTHNHPSGTLHPSKADKQLTTKICDAARVMDIKVNDHVIFTDNGYYSFRDEEII